MLFATIACNFYGAKNDVRVPHCLKASFSLLPLPLPLLYRYSVCLAGTVLRELCFIGTSFEKAAQKAALFLFSGRLLCRM